MGEAALAKLPVSSLQRRASELARPSNQRRILDQSHGLPRFDKVLEDHHLPPLVADGINILQINLGKRCNMTCVHCHVDAGPDRRETMTRETIDQCLQAVDAARIPTIDLTGGAPEMNPHFKFLVSQARERGCQVIDRSNLTILLTTGFLDLPEFLAEHDVEIVASLPCYMEDNADAQRGDGAFRKSIQALRKLNSLGYGRGNLQRQLTLVFNPVGTALPPDQQQLEWTYRRELATRYDIGFDRLFTITNMPISRYLEFLLDQGEYERYLRKLVDAFNPAAAAGVMCRRMLSVGWDGSLFDCDFNQMLELSPSGDVPGHISQFDWQKLAARRIVTGRHCFGCTAAAGSGCLGAIDQS